MNFSVNLNGHELEYFDDVHIYLCDGVKMPSITQLLNWKFGRRYADIDKDVLRRAAEAGTQVHEAIEAFCTDGTESNLPELRGFKFLKRMYKFTVRGNELPVLLCWTDGKPMAAGRMDMLIEINGQLGIADIKRTSALNKAYLAYQLNLYRIAYMQTYGQKIEFLRGLHLREDVRKFVRIPIEADMTFDFLQAYRKEHGYE